MKIKPGDAVQVTVQSSNPADPPGVMTWLPQPGKTELTVTLASPEGDSEKHTFTVKAEK